ncbi:hypothetical protein EVAR_61705_1 [Eumeta japonica]|uniref:Uncharacterized protein n=1 Tax=Eumeta variegata TaxID=151549 RepID=A0A4C1ZJK1_EUMVA|nr:hypothetical protein EVAR_61705_1 [Eumeta japonica]
MMEGGRATPGIRNPQGRWSQVRPVCRSLKGKGQRQRVQSGNNKYIISCCGAWWLAMRRTLGRQGQEGRGRSGWRSSQKHKTIWHLERVSFMDQTCVPYPICNGDFSYRRVPPQVASVHERTLLIQRISCGVAAINDGQRFSDFFIQPSFLM